MRQWKGDGSWSGESLPDGAIRLRNFYRNLLNLIQELPAFYKGRFYDLMWANKENTAFNSDVLFAFLKYDRGKIYLVLANFSSQMQSYKLRIPADAMDLSGMDSARFYHGKDLLQMNRGIQFPGEVARNGGFGGKIEPFSAAIYELTGQLVV